MPIASPRYAFNATMVSGAPPDQGVFALWEGDELIYYGRAHSIHSRLLAHLQGEEACTARATHYGWEISSNPAVPIGTIWRAKNASSRQSPPITPGAIAPGFQSSTVRPRMPNVISR